MFLLRIRYERLKRGWNQTDLARIAHIQQQDISLIEQGRLIPNVPQLMRLATALELDPLVVLKPVQITVDNEPPMEMRTAEGMKS